MIKKLSSYCFIFLTLFLLLFGSIGTSYSNDIQGEIEIDQYSQPWLETQYNSSNEWYFKPDSYKDLVEWYKNLESKFPDYLEVFKANQLYNTGIVAGGYDLYYVRITNESRGFHKPEVLFLGSPHGDETAGTIGMYWFTEWLMRKTFTNEPCKEFSKDYLQWILDHREIYFEISHNPYGFDTVQRYDVHGWDLNREADYNGPGTSTGGLWASVPGKTLVEFVNSHTIRVGCDFHGGARMLIYPWASNYLGVTAESLITGKQYQSVPPDFHYFDAASLRLGNYIGDFGGNFTKNNVGTIREHISYLVKGGLTPWGYAADVIKHPSQDPFVKDEKYGNYPGTGILWITPEMSSVKNPRESNFGNDTILGFGQEVRRFLIHQTDLAQPYVRWISLKNNNQIIKTGSSLTVSWQVNGSLVVDNTSVQWGKNKNPIDEYQYTSKDYNEYNGCLYGGTGWDNAKNGQTSGKIYTEQITFDQPGEYYIVAKAKVDQRYKNVIYPEIYENKSYLRLIQERTNQSYYEVINGTDGIEEVKGQNWWYSSIVHVIVRDNQPPSKPEINFNILGKKNNSYHASCQVSDPENDKVFIKIDWGDGTISDWIGPYQSHELINITHNYQENKFYLIKIKAKDIFDEESPYAYNPVYMSLFKQDVSLFPHLFRWISQVQNGILNVFD